MKSNLNIMMSLLMIITSQAFAETMLIYPNGQPSECIRSYEAASAPKTANSVLTAMTPICRERGGSRVIHQEITKDNSTELKGVSLKCIVETPTTYVIFNCPFTVGQETL